MSSTDQGGGKRRAGIVRWRPQKSLVSEGILFKSAEGEPLRYQLVRQTYGAHVRRRGMKARPPSGGFAFQCSQISHTELSQISHKAELMPVERKSSVDGVAELGGRSAGSALVLAIVAAIRRASSWEKQLGRRSCWRRALPASARLMCPSAVDKLMLELSPHHRRWSSSVASLVRSVPGIP